MELVEAVLRMSCAWLAWLDLVALVERWPDEGPLADGSLRSCSTILVEAAGDAAAATLHGLEDAFAAACAQGPGLEPEVVLRVFCPELAQRLAAYRRRIDAATADGEQVRFLTEELVRIWRGPGGATTGKGG